MKRLVVALLFLAAVAVAGQEQLPRFRSGANLVNVDVYFTKDGKPVTDLKPDEIEILEDDQPQKIENIRLVNATGQGTTRSKAAPTTVAAARAAASELGSRVFVLFLDSWHVSREGSAQAAAPVAELLNRVVGANDLVGVMTPDLSASGLSLSRRTDAIENSVRDNTAWGRRDTVGKDDQREREIDACYPENDREKPQYRGIAKAMIERRREQKTLRSLDALVAHLATLNDERKYVVLLTEGWVLFRQDEHLAAILEPDSVPSVQGVGASSARKPGGTATNAPYDRGFASCERERSMLAFLDHSLELRLLSQRANRANVTFFAVDPRGIAPFDDSIGPMRPADPPQDRERMASRQGGLRELAGNTGGAVILNTNDVKAGITRIMSDLISYYLMQYYSTNGKLDGKFRSISVRVKRPGVQVRARPGYLAPTEAEAKTFGVAVKTPSLPAGVVPISRRASATALRRGPSTGLKYVVADEPRFRRTERLRVEFALPAAAVNATGRVLTSQNQATPLIVSASTQQTDGRIVGTADVALAPLAIGAYVLELAYEMNGTRETAVYQFQVVP